MSYIYNMTDTWNDSGTVYTSIKMNATNTASAAGSKLIDLQLDGASRFSVDLNGNANFGGTLTTGSNVSTGFAGIELGGGRTGSGTAYVDFHSAPGTDFEARVIRYAGANGGMDIINLGTGGITVSAEGAGDVVVKTNATERMRVVNNGNVGIGTTSPSTKLAVTGAVSATENFFTAANSGVWFNGANNFSLGVYSTNSSADLALATSNTERMRITAAGRVGIGTTTPGAPFENVGQTRLGANVAQSSPSATDILSTAHTALSGNGGNYLTIGQYETGLNFAQWIQSSFSNPTTAVYNLVLQPLGGNVGIGTTSPTDLLDVNGKTIRVRSSRTPASATAAGATGSICWDSSYVYVCVDTNTWKRAALSTW